MADYITETFELAGITPEELKADPSLMSILVAVGMKLTRGQANPHILEHELETRANG